MTYPVRRKICFTPKNSDLHFLLVKGVLDIDILN